MNFKSLLLIFGIAIFSACGSAASKLYNPTEVNAKKGNTSVDALALGKTLYIGKCNECHRLYKPSKYSTASWSKYVDKMQERAKISDSEKAKILLYLSSEVME